MKVVSLINFLIISSAFVALAFINNRKPNEFYVVDYAFLFGLLICSILSLLSFIKTESDKKKTYLYFIGIFVASAILRFFKINQMSLWEDECLQFSERFLHGEGVASFIHFQMPLDYVFSGLSQFIFGTKEFAVRFFPAVFGSIACGVYYLLAQQIFKNRIFLICTTSFFVCSPWMIRYSQNGRVYSLSILTGLLITFILWNEYKNETFKKPHHLFLIATATFSFLSSTFVQNYIFIFSLNLILFFAYRPTRKHFLSIVGVQISAFTLLLYNFFRTIKFSLDFTGKEFLHDPSLLLKNENFTFINLIHTSNSYFNLFIWYFSPLVILYFLCCLLNKRSLSKKVSILLSTWIVFSILFVILYFTIVSYWVSPRFTLVIYPIVILSSFKLLEWYWQNWKFRILRAFILTIAIAIPANNLKNLAKYYSGSKSYEMKTDWRTIYSEINKTADSSDLVLATTNDQYGMYRDQKVQCYDFYLKNSIARNLSSKSEIEPNYLYLRHRLDTNIPPHSIHLILRNYDGAKIQRNQKSNSQIKIVEVFGGTLFSITPKHSWKISLLSLLNTAIDSSYSKDKVLTLLLLKMETLLNLNKKGEALLVLNELQTYNIQIFDKELFQYYFEKIHS